MIYGHNKTIHRNTDLNVAVDNDGNVVSVWFRCVHLPFTQSNVDDERAGEMRRMYEEGKTPKLIAVEIEEGE